METKKCRSSRCFNEQFQLLVDFVGANPLFLKAKLNRSENIQLEKEICEKN